MSNIIGTMYLIDEPHIDVLKSNLASTPPPGKGVATGTMLCMDMDESDNMLELWFPDHTQKATILCPPPIAMYKEIDGDQEGFIEEYYRYLDYDDSVQDFLASMLLYLHIGGHILLYTPSHLEDDAIWLNTLVLFFYTRYGITIGTGASDPFRYDERYDVQIANFIYERGFMDVFDFINSSANPFPPFTVQEKLYTDLLPLCQPGDSPLDMYQLMVNSLLQDGAPIYKAAITFDR